MAKRVEEDVRWTKNKDHKTLPNISTGNGAAVLVTSHKFFALPALRNEMGFTECMQINSPRQLYFSVEINKMNN